MTEGGSDRPPAGAGPAFGDGPPPTEEGEEQVRGLTPLAARLRQIAGGRHVFTHAHQLETYASDGLGAQPAGHGG